MKVRLRMFMVLATLVIGVVAALPQAQGRAQSSGETELLMQGTLADNEYPAAPVFVRLLRINMAAGSSSPLHTHPGPEFGLVEQGNLTVQVNGPARLSEPGSPSGDGTPVAGAEATTNTEFELAIGEQIVYLPQTPMTFRNGTEDPLSIMSVVILPAGNQHPPGITYLNGQPAANAFDGVSPEILGDGVATVLPRGGMDVVVERIRLAPGEPIPASDNATLLSLERGILDFTVISGKAQVTRTATPGPQPDTAPQTEVSLSKGDAVFFPLGMKEVVREGTPDELVLLRLSLVPAGDGPTPTPSTEGQGEIIIATPDAAATPALSTDGSPTADVSNDTPTATATPDDGTIREGSLVESNSEGVNVRSGPGTDFEIAFQVFTGDQMTVTGPSEEGDGYVWWPVVLVDDPSVTGYVAEEFIDLVVEE